MYYGVRYAAGCSPDELWITYFTSSKRVKELIERDGINAFMYEVRKIFKDVNGARLWECKVLKRMNVVHNDKFLNQTDNISISPLFNKSMLGKFGPEHNRFGKKNKFLSDYNKQNPKCGELNGMHGRTGNLHPAYGKRGKDSPVYGKERADLKRIVSCPHCTKQGAVLTMNRWHFNNCKQIKGI